MDNTPPLEIMQKRWPRYYFPEKYTKLHREPKRERRFGLTAFKRGWQAAHEGKSLSDNPYPDYRTHNNRITFSRAYRISWMEGYKAYIEWNRERVSDG
jgi:ribosome modulation factor